MSVITTVAGDKPEPVTPTRDFWVVAALDYDLDEAWIVATSDDAANCDLIDGNAVSDSIDWSIAAGMVPGLYKLKLHPWSRQSYEGEWDSGVDVDGATLLVAFPAIDPKG